MASATASGQSGAEDSSGRVGPMPRPQIRNIGLEPAEMAGGFFARSRGFRNSRFARNRVCATEKFRAKAACGPRRCSQKRLAGPAVSRETPALYCGGNRASAQSFALTNQPSALKWRLLL